MLTKAEVLDWKRNRVTQAFLDIVDDERERLKEHVITGGATSESVDGTVQLIAKSIGKAEALDEVMTTLIEDLLEEAVGDDEDED